MSSLTAAGLAHLTATFRRIDDLLAEAEADLAPAQSARLFSACIPDAAPIQHRLICDRTQRARKAMHDALARFDAALPPPHASAVWTARTRMLQARIAAAELIPEPMRRHGPLAGDTERDIRMMASGLTALLDQMESDLAQGPDRMLPARLQRIAATEMDGSSLVELERIVSAHGLAECRPALEQLAGHLASGQFEVAVFGRVNSGKSSLLNHLLKASFLPVAVTPVTAIPVSKPSPSVGGREPNGTSGVTETIRADLHRLGEMDHQIALDSGHSFTSGSRDASH